jgi:hypothetical protein
MHLTIVQKIAIVAFLIILGSALLQIFCHIVSDGTANMIGLIELTIYVTIIRHGKK